MNDNNTSHDEIRISIRSYKDALSALDMIHRNRPRISDMGKMLKLNADTEDRTELIIHRIELERNFLIQYSDEELSPFVRDAVKFHKELVEMGETINNEKVKIARARECIRLWRG